MCMVTVVNRKDKTKKRYFVNDSKANVSALIQQSLGSFEDIFVEDLYRKDAYSLVAMLMSQRAPKMNEVEVVAPFKKTFPAFDPKKW